MSDSVGKITLDLDVKSDINSQIQGISEKIGNKLKSAIGNSTKNSFDNLARNATKLPTT
jgi:hypothetical protein